MVTIMTEKQAKNLFVAYPDVVAMSWDGNTRPSADLINEGVELSYMNADFLPDRSEINDVINGTISLKSVIKKVKKSIFNYTKVEADSAATAISFAIILRMYESAKRPVLVFVKPEAHDKVDEEVNKIMSRIISEVFAEIDMVVVGGNHKDKKGKALSKKYFKMLTKATKGKVSKHTINDSGKEVVKRSKKACKKVTKKVRDVIGDSKYLTIGKKGIALVKRLETVFAIEIRNAGITQFKVTDLRNKKREALAVTLMRTLTSDNLNDIGKMNPVDKKDEKMLGKSIAKIDKNHTKQYNTLRKALKETFGENVLPKIKFGYKKNKSKDKEKFVKFFTKSKNAPYLALTYAHLAAIHLDVTPGKSDYKKLINGVLAGSDIAKEDIDMILKGIKAQYVQAEV